MPVSTRFCLGIVRESSFLLSADPNAGGCALEGLLFAYPAPGLRHPRLKVPRPAEPSQEEPGSRCFLSRPPRNRLRPTTSSVRYTQRTCVRRSLVWSVLAGAQDPDSRKSKRLSSSISHSAGMCRPSPCAHPSPQALRGGPTARGRIVSVIRQTRKSACKTSEKSTQRVAHCREMQGGKHVGGSGVA